jgi:gliding motility-associated-like protein
VSTFKIFILIIIIPFSLLGQTPKNANNWFFGKGIGLNFKTSPPNVFSTNNTNHKESNSSYSDDNGNLLLYFYDDSIFDANQNLISNGHGIKSYNSGAQSSLILKHNLNDSIFFLITNVPCSSSLDEGIFLTKILQKNNNFYVIEKNIKISNSATEKLNAVYHQNGDDIWIASHHCNSSNFEFFLLKKDGIDDCSIIQNIGTYLSGNSIRGGYLKFSPSGKYLINCTYTLGVLEIFKFNTRNGNLSKKLSLNESFCMGIEFSNNENFFYMFQAFNKYISQFSLKNYNLNDITISKTVLHSNTNNFFRGHCLQLAPDKKIYFNVADSNFLSCIEFPDSQGLKCSFVRKKILLGNRKNDIGLANFNQSYFYTPSINYCYEMNCTKNSIQFWGKDTFRANSHTWHSRKQYGVNSYSLIGSTKDINYTFADTGTYEVRYIASNGNRADTVTKSIVLYEKIKKDFLGQDTIFVHQHTLQAPKQTQCQSWYFAKQDSTVGGGNFFVANIPGTYICKITNQAFCQGADTIVLSNCFDSLPKKLFSSIDSIQCFNQQQFAVKNNIKPQNNNKYSWYLNNVLVSNNFQIDSFKTNSFGQFNLKLTLKNNHTVCKDSFVKKFEVKPNPIANFTINQTTQCADNQKFDFTNNSIFPNKKKQIIWQLENQIIDTFQLLNYQFANTGNYTIKLIVTDSNSCSNEYFDSVRVINKPPSSSFLNQAVFCFTNQNILAQTNKLFNDSITWILNNNITQKNTNDSLLLNNLAANNYQLIINKSNAERCFNRDTLHFEVLPTPSTNFTINKDTQCLKNNLFVFNSNSLASNDSIVVYQYTIKNQTFNTKITNYSFANSGNFNIKHSIETKNGCKDSVFKTIFVADIPYPQISADSVCIGEKISLNANPKTNINSWLWILSNGDIINQMPPVEHLISQTGTYHVKLIVKNNFNCSDTIEKQNAYTIFPLPNAQFKIYYQPINNNAYSLSFNPEIIKNNYKYTWTLPNGEQIDQDSFTRIFNKKTQGKFSLKTTNEHGCINQSDSVFYFDLSEFKVFIPNAFTPNSDVINPEFKPVNISKNLKSYTLEIFDPWGGKIFETNNPNIGWNGQYKGETVAQGVYVYVIKTISNSDDKTIYKGVLLVMW